MKADARVVNDAAITTNTATLTSNTAAFSSLPTSSADVGKTVVVAGAGPSGVPLTTTITAVVNSTTATLAANAATTVSNATAVIGTENTSDIQAAIDAAYANNGGTAIVNGPLLCTGRLTVKPYVTLSGPAPANRNRGRAVDPSGQILPPTQYGAVLLTTQGHGQADFPLPPYTPSIPFITVQQCGALTGVAIYHPLQTATNPPVPYPFAIVVLGQNATIRDLELINPYQGIWAGDKENMPLRLTIEHLAGQPLFRGIVIDYCMDTPRIIDVQFVPEWNGNEDIIKFQINNAIAFKIDRIDQLWMERCYCFLYYIGFIIEPSAYDNSRGYGDLVQRGADRTTRPVVVTGVYEFAKGYKFTNCGFISNDSDQNHNDYPIFEVQPSNTGDIGLVATDFWGSHEKSILHNSAGTLSVVGCSFQDWAYRIADSPAIDIQNGSAIIVGNLFKDNKKQVKVAAGVKARILGNQPLGSWQPEIVTPSTDIVVLFNGVPVAGDAVLKGFDILAAGPPGSWYAPTADTESVLLPEPGTYDVWADILITASGSIGSAIVYGRWQVDGGSGVANSETRLTYQDTTALSRLVRLATPITVTGPTRVRPAYMLSTGATWTFALLEVGPNQHSRLGFVKRY